VVDHLPLGLAGGHVTIGGGVTGSGQVAIIRETWKFVKLIEGIDLTYGQHHP